MRELTTYVLIGLAMLLVSVAGYQVGWTIGLTECQVKQRVELLQRGTTDGAGQR